MSGATMFIDGQVDGRPVQRDDPGRQPGHRRDAGRRAVHEQQGKMILTLRTGWGRIQLEDFTDLRTATVDYRNTREGG
jgi:hypothetical protein